MTFSIIVATSKNGVIGIDNKLPWHLPQDLKYFKKKTTGKTIIMGRKTYESIGKPLPNRHNIVLTRDVSYEVEGITVFNDINDLINSLPKDKEHMVIGGGEIYNLFLPHVERIYHTLIDIIIEGDTKFLVAEDYKLIDTEIHTDGKVNGIDNVKYAFNVLVKN